MNDRSGNDKKSQILSSTIHVLMDKGVAHTSMNDIVRESGVSKGGVYHHFPSKDALLIGVIDEFYDQYMDESMFAGHSNSSAYEQLCRLITGIEDMVKEMGNFAALFSDFFAQSAKNDRLRERFQEQYIQFQSTIVSLIEKGIQSNEFKPNVSAKSVATGIIGLFDGIGCANMIASDSVSYPADAVYCARLLLDSIRT